MPMNALESARFYIEQGFAPVPIPFKKKKPAVASWQKLRLTPDTAPEYFNGKPQNIGILVGKASGGLVDIDLDCPETVLLAPRFLPRTPAIFGRKSKPKSHWLYQCGTAPKYKKFSITDSDDSTLVEFRSGEGKQTVFPPSTHVSGEKIDWDENFAKPARRDGNRLLTAVAELASAAALARAWPDKGARQDCAMALAGALLKSGWPQDKVHHFLEAVLDAAGDEEVTDRLSVIEHAARRVEQCEAVWGWPKLGELIDDESLTKKVKGWLSIKEAASPAVTTFTAADLQGMQFPDPKWAVPNLVPEGLTLLAGKPKVGKSWLVLGLAWAVAAGGKALGQIKVEGGDVLYLALEDTKRRLQARMAQMNPSGNWPTTLTITIDCPRLDQGGLEFLEEWLTNHPDARLVVIDTLARFRPPSSDSGSLYDKDYLVVGALKQIADKFSVAILVVHHLRKMGSEDPFDQVSGTHGLTGSADGTLILQRDRGRADAALILTGRDVEEQDLALKWDKEYGIWSILGDGEDYRRSQKRQDIIEVLRRASGALGPKAIADCLHRDIASVKMMLGEMVEAGEISKAGRGAYECIDI
jgi:hypothetical protein